MRTMDIIFYRENTRIYPLCYVDVEGILVFIA